MEYDAKLEKKLSEKWLKIDKLQKENKMDDKTANYYKEQYHKAAETIRARAGYSGGPDGTQKISLTKDEPKKTVEKVVRKVSTTTSNNNDTRYENLGGRTVESHKSDDKVKVDTQPYKMNNNLILYGIVVFIIIGLFK